MGKKSRRQFAHQVMKDTASKHNAYRASLRPVSTTMVDSRFDEDDDSLPVGKLPWKGRYDDTKPTD